MTRVTFFAAGHPEPYNRDTSRWGGNGFGSSIPEKNRVWRAAIQDAFAEEMRAQGLSGIHDTGAVCVALAFHGSRADMDNLLKEALDALNGHAYKDDRQVYQIEVARGMDPIHPPGAHVMLTFTSDDPFPKKAKAPRKKKVA